MNAPSNGSTKLTITATSQTKRSTACLRNWDLNGNLFEPHCIWITIFETANDIYTTLSADKFTTLARASTRLNVLFKLSTKYIPPRLT